MNVVLTNQSIDRLEKCLRFYLNEMEVPLERVLEIKDDLLESAKRLSKNPYKGQLEPYLIKLNKGHRRIIKGNIKIIYRIEEKTIYITDFFDTRRSPSKMTL